MRNEKGFFKRNYRKIKSFLKNPGLYMADSILSYYLEFRQTLEA